MIALQGHDLQATYIADPIFSEVNFTLHAREKVGLVGANGAGKTTLFRGLTGDLSFEKGRLSMGQGMTMGYLEQHVDFPQDTSLIEAVMSIYDDLFGLWDDIRDIAHAMGHASGRELDGLMAQYAKKMQAFEEQDGYAAESKVRGIVRGLGFGPQDEDRQIHSFSGGEKTRLMLARLLVREPDILLLDEPTNHLDIQAVEWLEGYLRKFPGALLVISHDRYFLDQIVDRIFEMAHGQLKAYNGNYSQFLHLRAEEEKARHKAYLQQQEKIRKEKAYIERNRAGVHAKQARGREKRLQKIDRIEDVKKSKSIRLISQELAASADIVLRVSDLKKSYGDRTIFQDAQMEIRQGQKVGLIGPNGVGKSTFLKIVAGLVQADSGQVDLGNRVKMAYYDQEQALLNPEWTVLEQVLRTTSLLKSQAQDTLAGMLFFEDDLEKPTRLLSGGERGRLGLLLTLLEEPNFIVMDEPTNHLDIPSKEIMEGFLQDFGGSLLLVSHDRYFLNAVTDHTYVLQRQGLTSYMGNYAYYKEKEELARLNAESANTQKAESKTKGRPDRELGKEKSRLKKALAVSEEKIAALESDLEGVQGSLVSTDLTYEDYERLSTAMQTTEAALEEEMEAWSELAHALEEMEAKH